MNQKESKRIIEELLNRPLITKIKDMLTGIEGNICAIMEDTNTCDDPKQFNHMNGQVYAFAVCRSMLQSILKLHESKCGCGCYVAQETKDITHYCCDCKRGLIS